METHFVFEELAEKGGPEVEVLAVVDGSQDLLNDPWDQEPWALEGGGVEWGAYGGPPHLNNEWV